MLSHMSRPIPRPRLKLECDMIFYIHLEDLLVIKVLLFNESECLRIEQQALLFSDPMLTPSTYAHLVRPEFYFVAKKNTCFNMILWITRLTHLFAFTARMGYWGPILTWIHTLTGIANSGQEAENLFFNSSIVILGIIFGEISSLLKVRQLILDNLLGYHDSNKYEYPGHAYFRLIITLPYI